MIGIIKQVLLYERMQCEYDLMIVSMTTLSDEAIAKRIREVIIKTLILELVVEEYYTQDELDFLIKEDKPLELMYDVFISYLSKCTKY